MCKKKNNVDTILKKFYKPETLKRRNFLGFIFGTFTLGILVYWLFSVWKEILYLNVNLRWNYLIVSFPVFSISFMLTSFVWRDILHSFGVNESWFTHIKSLSYSAIGRRLPGTIWYIGIRSKIYNTNVKPQTIILASSIEMAVLVIASIPCSTFLLFGNSILDRNSNVYTLILIPIVTSIFVLNPKTLGFLLRKMNIQDFNVSNFQILKWILCYCIEWTIVGILLYFVANIFIPVSYSKIFFFIGCVAFTGLLSRALLLLPSNFGFTELTISSLLSLNLSTAWAPIIAISNRAAMILFELIWALGVSIYERLIRNSKNNP